MLKKLNYAATLAFCLTLANIKTVSAAIINPAIAPSMGEDIEAAKSGAIFSTYFIQIWQAIISVGALAVLLNFVWGAIDWITAGGDSGKIEKARSKITQSIIGLFILVGSFAIIGFINSLFFGKNFNILNPTF